MTMIQETFINQNKSIQTQQMTCPFPVTDVNESEMCILVTIIQTGHESLKKYLTMTQ